MRCPKCGYISFDHLEQCRKCHKNLEALSSALYGTAYNVQPPTFLNVHRQVKEEASEEIEHAEEQAFDDDEEYVDDELAILVEEEESELEGDIGFAGADQTAGIQSAGAEHQADKEIEIDFSQFEADDSEVNAFHEKDPEEESPEEELEQFSMKIDMPEELSDISDLAPPKKGSSHHQSLADEPAEGDFSELSFDDLNFDLDLDDFDKDQTKPGVQEEAMLALDELDFSDTPAKSSSKAKQKTGSTDMDLDLDFELDLGGLSIHKDADNR